MQGRFGNRGLELERLSGFVHPLPPLGWLYLIERVTGHTNENDLLF